MLLPLLILPVSSGFEFGNSFGIASIPSCVREVTRSAAHTAHNHLCFAAASDVAQQSLFALLEEAVNIQSWLSLRFFTAFHYLSLHFTLSQLEDL